MTDFLTRLTELAGADVTATLVAEFGGRTLYLPNPRATGDELLVRITLNLARQQGMNAEIMFRAALPSIEELEAKLGSDLVEQGRNMVAIAHANNRAAALALDEGVSEFCSVNLVSIL